MSIAANKINDEFLMRRDGPSGHTFIQVDTTGQNCILLYGGANQSITCEEIDSTLKNFTKGDGHQSPHHGHDAVRNGHGEDEGHQHLLEDFEPDDQGSLTFDFQDVVGDEPDGIEDSGEADDLEIGNGQEKNALQLAERSGRQQGSSRMGCQVRRRDGRRGRAERRHV